MVEFMRPWSKFLRGVRLGAAYSKDGWVMPFTNSDVAWLCRALIGESSGILGPSSDAVSWTMINHAYWRRDETWDRRGGGYTLRPPHSLTNILLAYCQPINPYWRNRGEPWQVEKRNRFATMTPGAVEREAPGLIDRVIMTLRGRVSGEPYRGLVDFAECSWGEGRHGPSDSRFGNNCFWYGSGTRSWPEGQVRVLPPGSPSVMKILVPVGLQAGAVAAVAFESKLLALAGTIPFLPP